MSPQPERGVMGSLPRSRPHRRSDKRPQAVEPTSTGPDGANGAERATAKRAEPAKRAKPAAPKARAAAAKPATMKPKAAAASRPDPPSPAADAEKSPGALETAVQAVAELTEIGLHAGARALRGTLSRLSR